MTEVVFGPIKETTDWRWREILDLEPFEIMKELKELDTALFAARSELREAVRELADLEDRLHRAKQGALEAITDPDLTDSLFKGGTKDERAQRQETYLSGLDWVQTAEAEIKAVRERKDNAQVAFDSLLDRQVNLGKFANMYSATASLLASIHVDIGRRAVRAHVIRRKMATVVEPVAAIDELFPPREGEDVQTLYFVGERLRPFAVTCQSYSEVQVARQRAKGRGYEEASEVVYQEAMARQFPEEEEEGSPFPPDADVAAAVDRYADEDLSL